MSEHDDQGNNGETIDAILNAPNHYAVLGIDETADTTTLRRAYLMKSVQVHPDKNNDPRATQAFQRVAEAWTVLSNVETRNEYDTRNADDDDNTRTGQKSHSYTSPPPPSFQDALFAFAAATNMMGVAGVGGPVSAAGSMAETVYWAEKLVQGRASSHTEKMAHAAMAAGSGLRAVAFAARLVGMRNASTTLERSATLAQTIGVGALAANAAGDMPTVQKSLNEGREKAKELSGSINRSIQGHLQKGEEQLRRSIADILDSKKGG